MHVLKKVLNIYMIKNLSRLFKFKKKFWKFKHKKNTNKNKGFLLFFRRHSNIFLVLSNDQNKHIITLTAGSCGLGKKKKEKKAVHNMAKMVNKLLVFLKKNKIGILTLRIRQRLSGHFFNLRKLLIKNNIYISSLIYILRKPHGFIRGRKLRRI